MPYIAKDDRAAGAALPLDVKSASCHHGAAVWAIDEHDFGSFELAGEMFFWKIEYYDRDVVFGSEDPSDPGKTTVSSPSCSRTSTNP